MRSKFLEPEIYNKLFLYMQYENALAVRVSLATGWRIGDVLRLRRDDFDGNFVSICAQKTGKPDRKKLPAELVRRLKKNAGRVWVFEGRFGDKPRTRQTVWRDLKKAASALGVALDGVSPHSARKTYAVLDYRENGLAVTQKHLQHSRSDTTLIYALADSAGDPGRRVCGFSGSDIELLADLIAQRLMHRGITAGG